MNEPKMFTDLMFFVYDECLLVGPDEYCPINKMTLNDFLDRFPISLIDGVDTCRVEYESDCGHYFISLIFEFYNGFISCVYPN